MEPPILEPKSQALELSFGRRKQKNPYNLKLNVGLTLR